VGGGTGAGGDELPQGPRRRPELRVGLRELGGGALPGRKARTAAPANTRTAPWTGPAEPPADRASGAATAKTASTPA